MVISECKFTLDEVNAMSITEFVKHLGGVFEHSPWVAVEAYKQIPFHSIEHLHSTMMQTVLNADRSRMEGLLKAHPDLATRLQVTPLSASEQQGAGLDRLTMEEFNLLNDLNRKYTDKFQFPFILAVRGKNKDDIISAIGARVERSPQEEWVQAFSEIGLITKFRLSDLIIHSS
ncbi:2-oxo-4-hydroxy-4-carboxy-5-ureidoimidazoline decarboxylase [Paenibacillus sp. B-A-8]|uniref:2-oxo-4-hydroxy-4-carboxy-5-ureidoimidazoline decarboxylase n=1 Tax=Paenibacillus sp. B-A-8 TaxID=3400419 RepID=UPI003B02A856